MDHDFPDDLVTLRRELDAADAELERLHREHADRSDDPEYRTRVAELRARAREAAVALGTHPALADLPGGSAAARIALQELVAEERRGTAGE